MANNLNDFYQYEAYVITDTNRYVFLGHTEDKNPEVRGHIAFADQFGSKQNALDKIESEFCEENDLTEAIRVRFSYEEIE